jgi:oligoribonuclease
MQKYYRVHIFIPTGKCPVAGNSVYVDRLFMQRYLPEVDKYLHYRIVDVSTIKELCRYVYLKQREVVFM